MKSERYSNLKIKLTLKYFWQVVRNFKVSFTIVTLASVSGAFFDIYVPLQYLRLWKILENNDFVVIDKAYNLIFFILILNLIRWLSRRISGFTLAYFESSVIAGLKNQAFSYLIAHSHTFFANNFGGSLTQKINRYAKAFEKLTDRLIIDFLPLVVRGLGTVIAIYTLLPKYSYVLAIFSIVFIITMFIYIRYKLKYDLFSAEADSKTTGVIADSIGNHSSIQLFSGFNYERERVDEVVDKQKKVTSLNWYLWEGLNSICSLYSFLIEFMIFYLVIGDWKAGLITLPLIVLLQSYLIRLIENLWSFGTIVRTFYEGFADSNEMISILNTPYEIKEKNIENLSELKDIKGEISFNSVSYYYQEDKYLLKNFNIKINSGEKVALIGTSGAGKTTFVRLLMRLFDVKEGSITIDNIDIRDVTENNLHDQISFVPQEPVLFHRTLMENIRYGKRDATDSEVINASKLANCGDFIDSLEEGYNTYVGERGIKLSGGERQRIAIARAILKNAPILVLDEATSSLDSHSESLIQDALKKLIKGKTTIVIAHRLSTIRQMDRIIVIEKGKIIEEGNHEELLNKENGIYRKLWEIQALGFN